MQQQPIFPCRRQQSIVGASELNFCVRYENRWDLTAIVTAMVYNKLSLDIISLRILYDYFTTFRLSCQEALQLHRIFFQN